MLTVVIGPPTSGKTTYVAERAQPGDIVVDHDRLAEALGSPHSHNHPPQVHLVALAARRAAITEALARHRAGARVWIIHTHLTTAGVRRYEAAGAQVVAMPYDPVVLHRRINDAGRASELHGVVDRWQPVADPFAYGRTSEQW